MKDVILDMNEEHTNYDNKNIWVIFHPDGHTAIFKVLKEGDVEITATFSEDSEKSITTHKITIARRIWHTLISKGYKTPTDVGRKFIASKINPSKSNRKAKRSKKVLDKKLDDYLKMCAKSAYNKSKYCFDKDYKYKEYKTNYALEA